MEHVCSDKELREFVLTLIRQGSVLNHDMLGLSISYLETKCSENFFLWYTANTWQYEPMYLIQVREDWSMGYYIVRLNGRIRHYVPVDFDLLCSHQFEWQDVIEVLGFIG